MADISPQDRSGRTLTGKDKQHPSTLKGRHAAHRGEAPDERRGRLLEAVRRAKAKVRP